MTRMRAVGHLGTLCWTIGCASFGPTPESPVAEAPDLLAGPFGVVLYLNPINCELSGRDAKRLNALEAHPKIAIHVVFTSIATDDSTTARRAREDLGLEVPTSNAPIPDWADRPPFNRAVPLGVVVRAGSAAVFVGGQSMERTLDIAIAALGIEATLDEGPWQSLSRVGTVTPPDRE
ncbi:MAG: hypothetical protein U0974_01700 [Gemmatimonadales bacterium]|nr:hypothetical protein [Gemmatimonadales bacterium]MDZ4388431.1 hypothetical protein [Gemmatimonadales bacterium]